MCVVGPRDVRPCFKDQNRRLLYVVLLSLQVPLRLLFLIFRVIAEERDTVKFVDTVMSKLKHESFPPGTALATIGVRFDSEVVC